jgi:DNA repair protein RadC
MSLKVVNDRNPLAAIAGSDVEDVEDPQTRCALHGAGTLSLRECLSLILKGKAQPNRSAQVAAQLLGGTDLDIPAAEQARALFSSLEMACSSPSPELGILKQDESVRIQAAFEFARRYHFYLEDGKSRNRSGREECEMTQTALSQIGQEWRGMAVEWLGFVPVYQKSRLGNLCIVERGARTHVNTSAQELFARILVLRPQAVFLVHNHPSGNLQPSREDKELTRHVDDLCRKLGIKLLSHWIVSGSEETRVPMGGSYEM